MARPHASISSLPDESGGDLAIARKTEAAEVAQDDLLGLLPGVLGTDRQLMRLTVPPQGVG